MALVLCASLVATKILEAIMLDRHHHYIRCVAVTVMRIGLLDVIEMQYIDIINLR